MPLTLEKLALKTKGPAFGNGAFQDGRGEGGWGIPSRYTNASTK